MSERDPKTGRFPPRGPAISRGDGWGGPARGASATVGQVAAFQPLSNDPEVRARAAERVAALKEHIYTLATTAQREETQLAAAVAFIDREEGKPIQRQDLTSQGERIGYVIAAPEEDETPEAWQARQASHPIQ